ncbi:MAG: hypothetical protein HY286_04215 [Planctomycetes bacterium]|nr:hypothetical protein [Planctomycetota bacterium]
MHRSLPVGTAILLVLFYYNSAALAQDSKQDPKAVVESVVERAASTDVGKLWSLSDELVAMGKGKAERDAIRIALKSSDSRATLVLSRALLQIEKETFTDDVAASLIKVLKSNSEESESAAAMLGSNLLALEKNDQDKLTSELDKLLTTGGLQPKTRIATAQTLHKLGNGEQKSLALKELKTFFKSDDPELKSEGALALAVCGDVEDVRSYLKKMQDEPTDRGKLAKSLLDRDDDARTFRARLERASVATDDAPTPKPLGKNEILQPGDPRVLTEILSKIEELHVQGDQWTREDLVAAAARGMLNELDPHSTYFTAQEYQKMIQQLRQIYAGIGAQVRVIGREFTIVRPFFSAPAYNAGIRAGDHVVSIINEENGKEGEWATDGQPEDEVIKRLKGTPGTSLKLKVFRRGWTESKVFPIQRELIKIPLLESEMLPNGIAYFELLEFGSEVPVQLAKELDRMQQSGELKGVILDLRGNPGGFLESAQDLCSIFLPKNKLVCYTEGRKGARREFKTRRGPMIPESVPVAILINSYSASASEITAGCLQDYGRATIIGEHSFGKGSVQQLFPLKSMPDEFDPETDDTNGNGVHDEGEHFTDLNKNGKCDLGPKIKITIERYFLPLGRNVNTEYDHEKRKVSRGGIAPDLTVDWPILDLGREAEVQRLMSDTLARVVDGKVVDADDKITKYIREQFPKNPELFKSIAISDAKDTAKYPGFDDLMKSLKTWLDPNEVRKVIRLKIRDRVAEDRGKMFPGTGLQGDIEEDPQLRQAIAKLYDQTNVKFDSVPEYADLLKREKDLGINLGPKLESELKAAAASRPAEK